MLRNTLWISGNGGNREACVHPGPTRKEQCGDIKFKIDTKSILIALEELERGDDRNEADETGDGIGMNDEDESEGDEEWKKVQAGREEGIAEFAQLRCDGGACMKHVNEKLRLINYLNLCEAVQNHEPVMTDRDANQSEFRSSTGDLNSISAIVIPIGESINRALRVNRI
jgi:hypothetical protein